MLYLTSLFVTCFSRAAILGQRRKQEVDSDLRSKLPPPPPGSPFVCQSRHDGGTQGRCYSILLKVEHVAWTNVCDLPGFATLVVKAGADAVDQEEDDEGEEEEDKQAGYSNQVMSIKSCRMPPRIP